ncbi:hypothetical protein CEXT_619611 [Caerostris extrusa]|uniref:Uncharacterized protein n=1 Tax=Caerostris extrusa TaxID=172846 RepID=A0AAV4W5T2_CAEEX|nr:hypothetical protein CEXT_619611 [Caerostris extrusa]
MLCETSVQGLGPGWNFSAAASVTIRLKSRTSFLILPWQGQSERNVRILKSMTLISRDPFFPLEVTKADNTCAYRYTG